MNKLIDQFKSLEKGIIKIMRYGFRFSFLVCILSSVLLITYDLNPISTNLYYAGIQLFKTSLMFAVEFVICGLAMDTIKKQLI